MMTNTQSPRRIENTEVAKLIRKDLKRAFPGAKFSVRTQKYSGGSSIHVNWTDGPTKGKVESLVGHYKGANFDGMQDMKIYHDEVVFSENGPELVSYGNDFLFFNRNLSDEGEAKVIEEIARKNPWREFDESFSSEILNDDVAAFAPPDGSGVGFYGFFYRGCNIIHYYSAFMDL